MSRSWKNGCGKPCPMCKPWKHGLAPPCIADVKAEIDTKQQLDEEAIDLGQEQTPDGDFVRRGR